MRSNISLILGLLALLTITQAHPSFRILQQNVTIIDNTTNTTNNTNTTVNPHPGYTPLTLAQIQNDSNATAAYRHAINSVVQTSIAQGKVPLSFYTVSNLNGAWSRARRNGVYYIFNADLVGANGALFYCNVTVFNNYSSGNDSMTAYHYRGNKINSKQFPSGGYRYLTPAQVHNNTVVQGALVYGAKTMIEWLISQYKIPTQSLDYTLYNLYLAAYKRSRTGTSYKFQVDGSNTAGLQIKTNYTVFYTNSNQSYSQTAYWYRVWNYNRSDIVFPNNTNSTNVTIVDNNSTGNTNVTVVDNSTTVVVNNTGEVSATNATGGSSSTSGVVVNSTAVPEVNVNISLFLLDNSTATTTALISLNYTFPVNNTDNGNGTNTTLPATNVTIIDNTTAPAV